MSVSIREERDPDQSNHSRRRTDRQRNWLLIPLVFLLLMIAAALFFVIRFAVRSFGGKTQPTEPAVTTTAPDPSYSTENVIPGSSAGGMTEASGSDVTSSAVTEPTGPVPSVPTPTQPNPGDFHLYTAAEVLPLPADIERGFFKDVNPSDENGSWYFGPMTRDLATGVVTPGSWDRYASTLEVLDKYGAIYRKNTDQKVVYLTFDCGYEYGHTASILDTLKSRNVKAIFFCAGDFVNDENNKALLERMVNEGHLVGCHTDHHKIMPKLSDEEFIDELNNLQLKVNAMLGYNYQLTFYRPPEGSTCERDLCLAQRMGYTTVLWSYAYSDYNVHNQMEVSKALEKAKIGLHDGCVYLLHAVSSTNAAMLGDLIDYMKAEGYDIRRIDQ